MSERAFTGGHPTEDELVELALGTSSAPEALLGHLQDCATCRAAYDDLARATDLALAAAPSIAPPVGFETRVLARLGPEPAATARRRGRRLASLAAAAAVGVVAGGLGVAALTSGDDRVPAGATALETRDGTVVGSVLPSRHGAETVLVLRVDDGPPGMHYRCRFRLEDDSTRPAGEWTVPASGSATWIATVDDDVAAVELVTDAGTVWSSADVDVEASDQPVENAPGEAPSAPTYSGGL
jgi:hypothetical protein